MADSFESPDAWSERAAPAFDWRWLCRLSLVEPAVAVAWHVALLRSLSLPLRFERVLLLFASLWLVYMADRLLDVLRLPSSRRPRTERHRFAYEHPRMIAAAWCVALLLALGFALANLGAQEWYGGITLCSCTAIYLLFVHRANRSTRWLLEHGAKELGVAALFVVGSTLFIWTHPSFGAPGSVVTLGFALLPFFAVALQNLLHLARRERHIDAHHDCPSIAWAGEHGITLEVTLGASTILAAVANLALIATSTSVQGIPLSALLPINVGAALGSSLLLLQERLLPSLDQDAHHVIADVAVLLAAAPPLLLPAPFG
jgi:hypothetical protein